MTKKQKILIDFYRFYANYRLTHALVASILKLSSLWAYIWILLGRSRAPLLCVTYESTKTLYPMFFGFGHFQWCLMKPKPKANIKPNLMTIANKKTNKKWKQKRQHKTLECRTCSACRGNQLRDEPTNQQQQLQQQQAATTTTTL